MAYYEDTSYEQDRYREEGSGILTWLPLLIVPLFIILGIVAYNLLKTTGTTRDNVTNIQGNEVVPQVGVGGGPEKPSPTPTPTPAMRITPLPTTVGY